MFRCSSTPDTDVDISLGQLGFRLSGGHALGLTVASSDAPEFVSHWSFGGNRRWEPLLGRRRLFAQLSLQRRCVGQSRASRSLTNRFRLIR